MSDHHHNDCAFERVAPRTYRCLRPQCARVVRTWTDWAAHQVHAACGSPSLGLGDYLGLALAKFYITKDSVDRLLATIDHWRGKPPQEKQAGCGCTVRQQALNRFGWKFQHRANAVGWWFLHRWAWLKSQFCRH